MFGFGEKRKAERKMAEWLAFPTEFGVPPTSVRHKHTYKANLTGHGKVKIHMVDYVMPDGTRGRGFVNGPFTWSFIGEEINRIQDNSLVIAYCGWAYLFPALQMGDVVTRFTSRGDEGRFLAKLGAEGLVDVKITDRYQTPNGEFFEYTATRQGKTVKGAGNTVGDVRFAASEPCFHLPSIYFFVGNVAILSIKEVGV
jgi:hypothetical protein